MSKVLTSRQQCVIDEMRALRISQEQEEYANKLSGAEHAVQDVAATLAKVEAERDEARAWARRLLAERDAKSQAIEQLNGVIHYWMMRTYELAAERDKALLQKVKITYKTPKGEVEEINPVRVEIGKELPGSVTHKPFTYTTPTD